MWNFMIAQLRGILTILLFILDTFLVTIPFYTVALFKWIIPVRSWRIFCSWLLHRIADVWLYFLNLPQSMTSKTRWVIKGMESLNLTKSCLLMVNHQSWVDIMVLVRLFFWKIPDFKFFVKKELLWLPIVGQAFWAVDFPIVKRYSKSLLHKKPYLKGRDLEITRKACEKFKNMPVSIFNFVEGTRFRVEKHMKQHSPFTHLLRPKAGGTALVLGAMGEKVHSILNVTIVYPKGVRNFWDYLCGKVGEIRIHVEQLPVTKDLLGDYFNDPQYREHLQVWLNNLWLEKDRRIDEMLQWESASV
ncbi:MAG: acyltransferase [Desulfomonilia bacterium]|jgi:1-acyl-sn-glycerol-3-phosphate acyltransferase